MCVEKVFGQVMRQKSTEQQGKSLKLEGGSEFLSTYKFYLSSKQKMKERGCLCLAAEGTEEK